VVGEENGDILDDPRGCRGWFMEDVGCWTSDGLL
jgi:hypothetical protein